MAQLLAQGQTAEVAAASVGRSTQAVRTHARREGLCGAPPQHVEGLEQLQLVMEQFVAWRSVPDRDNLESNARTLGWTREQWEREEERVFVSQPTFARMCGAVGAALVLKSQDGACVVVGEDPEVLASTLKARRVHLKRTLKEQGALEGVDGSVVAHRERNRNGERGLTLVVALTWSRHLGLEPALLKVAEAAKLAKQSRSQTSTRRVRGTKIDAAEMERRRRAVTEESEREASALVAGLVERARARGLDDAELARRAGVVGERRASILPGANELTQVVWVKMCAAVSLRVVLVDTTGFELVMGEEVRVLAEQLRARRMELGIEAVELTQREGLAKTAQIKRERVPRKQGHVLPLLLRWAEGLGLKMELREQD